MKTQIETTAEAANLSAKFAKLKKEGVTQADFAREFDVHGGANMLNQHLKGRRPISLEAAIVYARGLGCTLAEISPRHADALAELPEDQMPVFGPKQRSEFAAAIAALFDTITDAELRARLFGEITATISLAKQASQRKTP